MRCIVFKSKCKLALSLSQCDGRLISLFWPGNLSDTCGTYTTNYHPIISHNRLTGPRGRDVRARARATDQLALVPKRLAARERTFPILFARDGFLIHRPDSFDGSLAAAESSISRPGRGKAGSRRHRFRGALRSLRHALNSAANGKCSLFFVLLPLLRKRKSI